VLTARETGRVPVVQLAIDAAAAGASAIELSARLQRGDPPVHLAERFASQGVLIVDPQALQPEDDEVVAAAIRSALTGPRAAGRGG
jgi:L-seryl-tRNA(Ser) seleniumtransferase